MDIPTKKLKKGFEIPVLGLGTYHMGEGDDKKDIDGIKAALALGINHIDTAENYAGGRCEEIVGEAIKGYEKSNLFITSKIQQSNLTYNGIKKAVPKILERMGLEYLNLLLMHRCPELNKFEETVKAMNELIDEGLVKNIGLSNTNTEHTKMLCKLSKHPFVANQVHLNLQFREPEKDGLLDYCQNNNMILMAWRPLNKGPRNKSGINMAESGIELIDSLCAKYNKTPAQISINWLLSQKNIITMVKTTNPEHIKENFGALGWEMEASDIEKLRKEYPNQQFISDTVPLA